MMRKKTVSSSTASQSSQPMSSPAAAAIANASSIWKPVAQAPVASSLAAHQITQPLFLDNKIHLIDVHPVLPHVVLVDRSQNVVLLYNYETAETLLCFSLLALFDRRKSEIEQFRILDRNFNNIEFPLWYRRLLMGSGAAGDDHGSLSAATAAAGAQQASASAAQQPSSHAASLLAEYFSENADRMLKTSGELISVKFYDAQIIATKLLYEKSNVVAEMAPLAPDAGLDALGTGQVNYINRNASDWKSLQNILSRMGLQQSVGGGDAQYLVLHWERRVVLLRLDTGIDNLHCFVDEIRSFQLEGRTITSIEFIYTQPLIALGCNDGAIRLWNYADSTILTSKILAHPKSVSCMSCILRDDPLNSMPSLVSCGADGSMCCWNLDKGTSEFELLKAHEGGGSVVDIFVDAEKGMITTLASDRSIAIWSTMGHRLKSFNTPLKPAMSTRSICSMQMANTVPSWLLLTASNNKLYMVSSDLNENTWNESIDIQQLLKTTSDAAAARLNPKELTKAKFYIAQNHPLKRNMVFVGSSHGLFMFKFGVTASASPLLVPATASGVILPAFASALAQSTPSNAAAAFGQMPSTPQLANQASNGPLQRVLFTVRGRDVLRRTAVARPGQKDFYLDPIPGATVPRLCNIRLSLSPSGLYLAVMQVDSGAEPLFELYNTMSWKLLASVTLVLDIAWSLTDDRYALLQASVSNAAKKFVSIYEVRNNSVQAVAQNLFDGVTAIFGGNLLGIVPGAGNGLPGQQLLFHAWDAPTSGSLSPLSLPIPQMVRWDSLSLNCALVYGDSIAIFSYVPEFKLLGLVRTQGAAIEDVLWWNGSLFVTTEQDVRVLIPCQSDCKIDSIVLASYGIIRNINTSKSAEEDSMEPIVQPRPKGTLSIGSILADELYLVDQQANLSVISMSHPVLKFKLLVAAGRVSAAADWLSQIPLEQHDELANYACRMGYPQDACQFESISLSRKFALCLEHHMFLEALHALEQLESDLALPSKISKLYLKLASAAIKAGDESSHEIALTCYERAAQLDPSHVYSLAVYYSSRRDLVSKLHQLQGELVSRYHGGQETRLCAEQMTLISSLLSAVQ